MGTNPSRFTACDRTWFGIVFGTRDDCPVEQVSWNDAQEFIRRLSERTGGNYRLPTEAEWEYAARAGGQFAYSWGNTIGSGNANCSGCGSRWDGKGPAPVGKFAANAFGLHDVHGNVWEWVQDVLHASHEGASIDRTAVLGSVDLSRRVLRGGSWGVSSRDLRAASRTTVTQALRHEGIGFRIARTN
jgi:formylglycine-generating enzyme required for sulfatase activity